VRRVIVIIISSLLAAFQLWAAPSIRDLSGYSDAARIILTWTSVDETGLEGYGIQRSTDGHIFQDIGYLEAQGAGTGYTYIDDSVFAKTTGRVYYYRLVFHLAGGALSYSETIKIESRISGVRHTWGSIKALFK